MTGLIRWQVLCNKNLFTAVKSTGVFHPVNPAQTHQGQCQVRTPRGWTSAIKELWQDDSATFKTPGGHVINSCVGQYKNTTILLVIRISHSGPFKMEMCAFWTRTEPCDPALYYLLMKLWHLKRVRSVNTRVRSGIVSTCYQIYCEPAWQWRQSSPKLNLKYRD